MQRISCKISNFSPSSMGEKTVESLEGKITEDCRSFSFLLLRIFLGKGKSRVAAAWRGREGGRAQHQPPSVAPLPFP